MGKTDSVLFCSLALLLFACGEGSPIDALDAVYREATPATHDQSNVRATRASIDVANEHAAEVADAGTLVTDAGPLLANELLANEIAAANAVAVADADPADPQEVAQDAGSTDGARQDGGSTDDAAEATTGDAEAATDDAASQAEEDAGLRLVDIQIAAVLAVINSSAITRADAAQAKLSAPTTQALARELPLAYADAQARQSALLERKRLAPRANVVSQELEAFSLARLALVNAALASEVDSVYLRAEVDTYEKVLSLLDTVLIPSACDAELKAELNTLRDAVAAQRVRASALLGSGASQG